MSEVSRYEFEYLRSQVAANAEALRGVAVMAEQVRELRADLAAHEQQHREDARVRAANRKWWVTAVLAAVAAVDGPILVFLANHVH